jgi:hypothetical protein
MIHDCPLGWVQTRQFNHFKSGYKVAGLTINSHQSTFKLDNAFNGFVIKT